MTHRLVALFITLVLGPLAGSLAGAAQPSAHVTRIGLLSVLSPVLGEAKAESFRQGLRDLGYLEGRDILLETRWAAGHRERLATLAAELVRLGVAVLVTESTVSALAAKQATDTIPIVMTTSANPVAEGLVASFARPGGTVTGLTMFAPELNYTLLRLLTEVVSQPRLVAVLVNAANPAHVGPWEETQAAAQVLGLPLQAVVMPALRPMIPVLAIKVPVKATLLKLLGVLI